MTKQITGISSAKALWVLALLLFLLGVFPLSAMGEVAEEITLSCVLTNSGKRQYPMELIDGRYKTYVNIKGGKSAYLEVATPKEMPCYGIMLHWVDQSTPVTVQVEKDGVWDTLLTAECPFLVQYISLPGLTHFRIVNSQGVNKAFALSEVRLIGEGELPPFVQLWEPTVEKADLMVISAHPDDELIFMGGTLPYYAGELGKATVVVYLAGTNYYREHELLDGLWLCGVRTYPVIGHRPDNYTSTLKDQYALWSETKLQRMFVELIRKHQPEVVVTHDLRGEYGHGAHKATADSTRKAVEQALSASNFPNSAEEYGTWEVKKLYLHLYEERALEMNWRIPLGAFGGKTALEVAREAYKCHTSQQKTRYAVEDTGKYSNAQFGLCYTAVGEDVLKNDFFENIP